MPCIMIVIDGIADRPLKQLDGKTILEVANIPNLHRVAKNGILGIFDPLNAPGRRSGSDTAHISILGYDPYEIYTGRGPIEVAGTGIKLQKGDVSLRCNYCTVDENLILLNRTADYIREGTNELEKALNEQINLSEPNVQFTFRNAADYRCVLHFRGLGLSSKITDTDPWKEGAKILESRAIDGTPESIKTSKLVNEFVHKSYEILNLHPVNEKRRQSGKSPGNLIMPRGAGDTPEFEQFYDKWKLRGACIAGVSLIKGLAALMGMDIIEVPGATGYIDSNFMTKGKKAIEILPKYDFILVHLEGTDEVSHDHMVKEKQETLERIDPMIGWVYDHLPEDCFLVVLSDHTTSTELGEHTADPPPIMITGPSVFKDEEGMFTERAARKGMLHRIRGNDILPILLDYMDKTKKFGA
ncbi:MAG TPA: 2,3-bisphosphoglycerate-independent phosphoglycerate mutase [Candidatus Deferrimicrobium sp.]|nr:2,3-bisphosphoglycerate-independent phosphoglycerate mutase [Candidatus Deferrimicrobium sp.]